MSSEKTLIQNRSFDDGGDTAIVKVTHIGRFYSATSKKK